MGQEGKRIIQRGAEALKHSSETPRLDSELLLSEALGVSREQALITETDKKTITKFKKLLENRKQGVPLAYLTRVKEFYGLEITVNENVMIPRPETEMLVDLAIEKLKNEANQNVVDLGTGSGCIALSLAKTVPQHNIFGIDISEKALDTARKNAEKLGLTQEVTWIQSNLLESFDQPIDLLIANLPYLKRSEIDRNTRHEPELALIDEGLNSYQKIIKSKKFNRALLEIPTRSNKELVELAESQGLETKLHSMADNLYCLELN